MVCSLKTLLEPSGRFPGVISWRRVEPWARDRSGWEERPHLPPAPGSRSSLRRRLCPLELLLLTGATRPALWISRHAGVKSWHVSIAGPLETTSRFISLGDVSPCPSSPCSPPPLPQPRLPLRKLIFHLALGFQAVLRYFLRWSYHFN